MKTRIGQRIGRVGWGLFVGTWVLSAGCQRPCSAINELAARDAIEHYQAVRADQIADRAGTANAVYLQPPDLGPGAGTRLTTAGWSAMPQRQNALRDVFTLGTFGQPAAETTSQPATRSAEESGLAQFVPPAGYWRQDIWHQMGHEALALGGHDFWKGFKTSFWDLENALALTATMGASITIRETGVDDAIRRRTAGHRQLGDLDETIQILGNPGTHFAGTGVLWLASALTKDVKQHEVAQTLTQALAVNGVTTLILKAAANTRAPDGERHAWPSGHTSSAFTVAAVLNEYYGPWVGVPSLALAGLVGYQRLDSRVHDFSDVVFGAMLGYVVGTSIARDQQAELPELFGMQVIPYADPQTGAAGLALYKQW